MPLYRMAGERGSMEPTAEFAHLQIRFTDQTQRRSEVIRPLLLVEDRTATQRAQKRELIRTPSARSCAASATLFDHPLPGVKICSSTTRRHGQ